MRFNTLMHETELEPGAGGEFEPEPQEESPEYVTADQFQQLQAQNEALLGYFQQQQAQQEAGGPQIDPLSDNFIQQLDSWYEQKTQPFQQFTEQYQNQQADEMAWDMIASAEATEGEFLLRESTNELPVASPHVARAIAEDLLPQMQERYGNTQKAVEAALTQAVKNVRAYEDAIGQAYEQRKQNELQTRMSAPMVPQANGLAAQSADSGASSEFDLVSRYTQSGLPRG